MTQPNADAVHIAHRRLRGQLVATPLVAAATGLPGMTSGRDLRAKLEVLQPAGSVYFRGAMHWLLRQLGQCKGIAVASRLRPAFAVAVASIPLRLPVRCFWSSEPPEDWRQRFSAVGCGQEVAADPGGAARAFCAGSGYRIVPGIDEPDFAAGLATVGLELAQELPAHCARVYVPAELAPALRSGLSAGGHDAEVVEVTARSVPDGLGEALAREHRVLADPEGLTVLAAALAEDGPDCCGVLLAT